MSTNSPSTPDLKFVIEQIQLGALPDPQSAREALARIVAEREELRKEIGTVEVAVDLIRDARQ